ncbi:MAG: hypothetical protein HYY10_01885 [Candidatus Liptonbacteria bacterium]|nr:hypothetical protein [Candidatus Liptonbacteria bacterium]
MKKFIVYAFFPAIAAGFLGAGVASAHGFGFGFGSTLAPDEVVSRHQAMFQSEATLLGISVDDVKRGWAEGKNMFQIAADRGITKERLQQKLQDARTAQMKLHLQALVNKGVITQAQADQRLKFMEGRPHGGMNMMGKGFGMGRR